MISFFLGNLNFLFRKSTIKNAVSKFLYIKRYKKNLNQNFNSFLFLKFFLISEIIKKKYKKLSFTKINNNYSFSEDWFSGNIPVWEKIIKEEFSEKTKLKYLEIGTFEGRSAIYISETFNNIDVSCVDPFDEYETVKSLAKEQEMKKVYETFLSNIRILNNKVKHFKVRSNEFFKDNNFFFDIIYIDGSHYYLDVQDDFRNSLNCLNKGGIIIFDDFLWDYYEKIEENPINGILPMLIKQKHLKIISASNQLIVKKIK